jgi:hypothetical protein
MKEVLSVGFPTDDRRLISAHSQFPVLWLRPEMMECQSTFTNVTIFHTSTDDYLNLAAESLAGMTRVTFPCDTDWHRFPGPR